MAEEGRNIKIHVDNLHKSFKTNEVLKGVSTDIYEGEVVRPAAENPPFCGA